MALSTAMRCFFGGLNADIPANWEEKTANADRFLQGGGAGFLGEADGGSATHAHDVPAHGHDSLATHFHRISWLSTGFELTNLTPVGNVAAVTKLAHRHAATNSAAASIHYADKALEVSSGTAMQPPFVRAIIIGPTDANQEIPNGAICFAEAAAPTGFTAEAPLNGKFVLGATSGGDGGGTGGNATHTHGMPGSHIHTADPHVHALTRVGDAQSQDVQSGQGRISIPLDHHDLSLGSVVSNATDSKNVTSAPGDSEPLYVKLLAVKNTSGSPTTPDGVIVGFVDAVATIPVGWALMDGTGSSSTDCLDKQIKCTTVVGEIGDEGGKENHDHDWSHDHGVTGTHGGHSVTQVDLAVTGQVPIGVGVSIPVTSNHPHTWNVQAKAEGDTDAPTLTSSATDGRYKYRSMIWIKRAAPTDRLVTPGPVLRESRLTLVGNN